MNEILYGERLILMDQEQDNKNASNEFQYGWCYTDHKDGKQIGGWRSDRVVHNPDYKDLMSSILEKKYGLPMPKEDEVFYGTDENLLFLNSHGIVVRVGLNQKIEDCVNPAIIQPLHWTKDEETGITVSIYPGIHIYHQVSDEDKVNGMSLGSAMRAFGNMALDDHNQNKGFIPVMITDQADEKMLEVMLDPSWRESRLNNDERSVSDGSTLTKVIESLSSKAKLDSNWPKSDSEEMQFEFNIDLYRQAFEYHGPLRRAFAAAFDEGNDVRDRDRAKRLAWEMAKNFHDQGYQIWGKAMPNGSALQGKKNDLVSMMKKQLGFKVSSKPEVTEQKRQLLQTRKLESPWKTKK